MPTISVIIPAYKVAPYIAEALESVFAQTFADFEVIVVNDGSPDTEEFEHALHPFLARISYLKQENRGAGAARNAALRVARGELIAFLDGDDVWLPNYLEAQLQFMRQRSCDLACADATLLDDASANGRTYMSKLMNGAPSIGDIDFLQLVSAERSLITSGVVTRRQSILDIGLFDESLRRAQDFDLWLRLALHGSHISYQRSALLKYRRRSDGLTGDDISAHWRELRVFDKIETAYDLSTVNKDEVLAVIRHRRALLQFELGKHYAARGDFEQALTAFSQSNGLRTAWKKQIALLLTGIAPSVMQAVCRRRV